MQTPSEIPLRTLVANGLTLRIADIGSGPLVLMVHGWPESWYSWRHQLRALADAGYRAVALDMPGYGGSDKFQAIEDYNIINMSNTIVGLLDALEEQTAIIMGHDWGAAIVWHTVQLHPSRFSALVNMSVPFRKHAAAPPLSILKKRFEDKFFYQLYFQKPGVAESEFDSDPAGILSRLYCSPNSFRMKPEISDKDYRAGGWIGRLGKPETLPDWLTQADLDYYVGEFSRVGFSGGINYYRNIDKNWEIMAPYADQQIHIPALFIAGDQDLVIGHASAEQLRDLMLPRLPNLKDVVLFPGIGHWVQQEVPELTNRAVLNFLNQL